MDTILARLSRLHPKLIDLSLGRVQALLAALNNPERRLPPVVHIAGTNGKGSLVAFLRAILEAAGYRVHAYTSPHLVRFNERILLAGRPIADDRLAALIGEAEAANADRPITFFEITTAVAFMAFARVPADVVLLETGLGGRLDATNLIDRPALTAITPVSLDHQQYLGDTLAEIAAEKAAILKPGVAGVIGAQPDEVDAVIGSAATRLGVTLHRAGADWSVRADADGMVFDSPLGSRRLPRPALAGPHQIDNAGMALACVERLDGFAVSDAARADGLIAAIWPARLQRLDAGPLADRLGAAWELWLDGGHNAAAGAALAAAVPTLWPGRPLYLILGMLNTKPPRDFLAPLAPLARAVWTVAIPGEANAIPAQDLAAAARTLDLEAHPAAGVGEAVAAIAARPDPGAVLICGSLYLAGGVLATEDRGA